MNQTASERMRNENAGNNKNYGNNRNSNQEKQNTMKDKITLRFTDQMDFEGQHSLRMTTSLNLCNLICDLFRPLPDFEGCVITVDPMTGALQTSLYFHLSEAQDDYSIVQSAEQMTKSTGTIYDKYMKISSMGQNRKLYLTDFGKEILFDFVQKTGNVSDPSKINWNMITSEQFDNNGYGQGKALLKVSKIDLLKIIPKFYKNEDKRRYQWNIIPIKPVGNAVNVGLINYLLKIERLDVQAVEELGKELGFLVQTSSFVRVN